VILDYISLSSSSRDHGKGNGSCAQGGAMAYGLEPIRAVKESRLLRKLIHRPKCRVFVLECIISFEHFYYYALMMMMMMMMMMMTMILGLVEVLASFLYALLSRGDLPRSIKHR
jgi:hypothetical protein